MFSALSSQLPLSQLFDQLPDNVLWMRAVRAQTGQSDRSTDDGVEIIDGQVVDFVIEYANPKALQTTFGKYAIAVGTSVRHGNPDYADFADLTFRQLCKVLDSGVAMEFEYFDDALQQWLWVTRSKAGDGILSLSRLITKAKEDTLEAERQRTLLDNVFNTSLITVFVYDAIRNGQGQIQDFRVRLVNERGREGVLARLGVDVTNKTLLEINPDSRQTGQFNLFCQVIESGQPIQIEQFYPGPQAWYTTSITKLNDGIVVMGNDITEQKQISLETERQRALLDGVLNASQDAVLVLEAIRDEQGILTDFRFTHANSMVTPLLGYSIDTVLHHTFRTLFSDSQEIVLFEQYRSVVESGLPYQAELAYPRNEQIDWFRISAVNLGDGLVVTFTDISATKRSALTIEQSANELRTVIDSAQVAIFLINPVYSTAGKITDFRFRTANQMTASYVGQEPDALMGELVSRWFPEYLTNGLFQRYVAIFETGRTQHFNFHFETNNLDSWESYTVVKVGGNILVTFTDFTELKKLQQRLEASATELQTVIDTCQTGIFLFSPVRNQVGDVIDFRFRLANRQLASYVGQEPEVVIGALGSTWFPDYKTNGLFDLYYKTYITGESQRFDFHYDGSGIDVWLDIMTTKSGDDVLVRSLPRSAGAPA